MGGNGGMPPTGSRRVRVRCAMVQHCSFDVFLFKGIIYGWYYTRSEFYDTDLCAFFANAESLHASSADLQFEASRTNIHVFIEGDIAR